MRKTNRGFTLIELLIAASIFSVIILSVYSAFHAGILSYRKIDSSFEIYQGARISLNRMELDLGNSFAYLGIDNKSGFSGGEQSLEFFSVLDYYKNGRLNTEVCRIKYNWDETGKALRRACYIGLDALNSNSEQESEILAAGVEKITFEYAYTKENSYLWQESWPVKGDSGIASEQEKGIPLAVRITLSLVESNKPKEETIKFVKVIPTGE